MHSEHINSALNHSLLVQFENTAELYYQAQKTLRYDYAIIEKQLLKVESNFPCLMGVTPMGGDSQESITDGHKYACGILHITSSPVVYSFGSCNNQYFEESMLSLRPDSSIFTYELDPNNLPSLENRFKKIKYFDVGLGNYDEKSRFDGKFKVQTMKQMMIENRHSYIDVLKIDIEGGEYGWLKNEASLLPRVGQLLIEFHINGFIDKNLNLIEFIDIVESFGLRLFHQEINIHHPDLGSEYSFIQKSWLGWNKEKHSFESLRD
jgi:hypothetical protein